MFIYNPHHHQPPPFSKFLLFSFTFYMFYKYANYQIEGSALRLVFVTMMSLQEVHHFNTRESRESSRIIYTYRRHILI